MSQCERKQAESLQAPTAWFDNYEFMRKDADHLTSLYGHKYAEAKVLRWQVEKAIRVIEKFLDFAKLPLTANMEKFVEPLEEFVVEAKAELKLWEEKSDRTKLHRTLLARRNTARRDTRTADGG